LRIKNYNLNFKNFKILKNVISFLKINVFKEVGVFKKCATIVLHEKECATFVLQFLKVIENAISSYYN